jgi:beta-lactamase regulating signal transducer with metallopeptidase domain
MNEYVERLGWVLVHSLWQFALVALLSGIIVRGPRRSSASLRYFALVVALTVCVSAPLVTWRLLPRDTHENRTGREMSPISRESSDTGIATDSDVALESQSAANRPADAASLAGQLVLETAASNEEPTGDILATIAVDESPTEFLRSTGAVLDMSWSEQVASLLRPWLTWIVAGWSFGVVLCSLRPLLGWVTLFRLKKIGVAPVSAEIEVAFRRLARQLGLHRAVAVFQSSVTQLPVVVGYFKPVVLLPMSLMTNLPPSQLEAILAHELAHVRRHDFLVNLLQTLIETLFFYHPAVWWLSYRLRIERELCCDDLAVNVLGNPVEYGRALVAVEELRGRSPILALGAHDGLLLTRIRRIVGATPDRGVTYWRDRWPLIWLTAASLALAIAALWFGLETIASQTTKIAESQGLERLPKGDDAWGAESVIGAVVDAVNDDLARDAAHADTGPIRVLLKLNRQEFLLGESIAVEYEMTNDGQVDAPYGKGGLYPDLRINDGFRMSAVRVDESGKPVGGPVANWPMPHNEGGKAGGFQLTPGETYSTTLFVTRYLRFQESGRYRLRVENLDRLNPSTVYSTGETMITLRQPTFEEARGVFERMKKAPRQAYDDNAMKFLADAADFQAMHHIVYLPILQEHALENDLDALQSLERIGSLDANEVLVAAMASALDRDDWLTARACFQHLKVCLPFPNWYIEPLNEHDKASRDRVARTWKSDFNPVLTRLAKRLNVAVAARMLEAKSADADAQDAAFLKVFRNGYFPPEHPQSLLVDIDYIYRCVGRPEDFADCLAAFAHSIELTKSLPLETHQYFRPRGSAYGFRHTVMYMLQRGAKVPQKPAHPGEAAALAIAVRTQPDFRPVGWQDELMIWLKRDWPYLSELILDYFPEPIPNEMLEYLQAALADDYIDLQIAACHIAEKHPRAAYRDPLQRILDTARDTYLRKFAVDAARVNGLAAKYDLDAPFVDAAAENAKEVEKADPSATEQQPDAATAPAKGLEFLAPYPKLHGLSLSMSEAQFRTLAAKNKLTLQLSPRDGDQSRYAIPTGDGHTVLVMFKSGNCKGIQRIRGEERVDTVSFESVSVSFSMVPLSNRQPEQLQIKADGSSIYHIDEGLARGNDPKKPEARLISKLSPQRLLELERLLSKTDWLKAEGGEGPATHTDAGEVTITVVRNKQAKTIKCLGMRPEPYNSLLWFLRGVAEQEHLVYVFDWLHGNDTNRQLALIQLRSDIEALSGKPGRGLPYLEYDYNRFLPTFSRMVRNPSLVEDEVLTAIKLVTFVRADSELEWIARLKHDRESRVREVVAEALADFGGERVVPLLVEMAPTTEEARWGLVRLGEIAVPSLVKLIEPGINGQNFLSEQMVRVFLDHQKELAGPIDERIVAAAREALAKTAEREERTEYFKEFLKLADSLKSALEKKENGKAIPGVRTTLLRFVGGDRKEPLAGVKVEITDGYGDAQKKFGPFTTDEKGSVKVTLPAAFYHLHLTSEKELPYLPVEALWNKASRGPSPDLSLYVKKDGVEKWLRGESRDAGYEESVEPGGLPRITYTLLPACELVLRAVDSETGTGLPGVEFYEENAVGEEWAHPIDGENLGSKFSSDGGDPAEASVTDKDGTFKRLVGANAGFLYGAGKTPAGYEGIGHEVEVPIVYDQRQAEHVFKFRRVKQSLKGRVSVTGPIPEVPPMKVKLGLKLVIRRNAADERKNEESVREAAEAEIPDDSLVIGKEGGLANVAIYLLRAPRGWKDSGTQEVFELRSADHRFQPHMSFVRVGQPIRLMSPMGESEHFGTHPLRSTPFSIVVPHFSTREVAEPFNKSEKTPIPVTSNMHSWQKAWLLALDHPFAAITDAEGRFEIRDLPAGEHRFIVWHERRGYLDKDLVVRVENGKTAELDLQYTAEQLRPR